MAVKPLLSGLALMLLALTACTRATPPARPESPASPQAPGPGAADPGAAAPAPAPAPPVPPETAPPAQPETPPASAPPEIRSEDLAALPAEVQAWAQRFREVPIGVARTFGDRTYLLVSHPGLCLGAASIRFWPEDTRLDQGGLVVAARFDCLPAGRERETLPLAVGSIPATDQPIAFELKVSWLPAFRNAHNVPEVPLPAESRGVIVQPAAESEVGARVVVRGFAARLFEGTVVARLATPDGKVITEAPTIAAGGMGPDWGSFVVELDASQVTPGRYWLEIGDYSMESGAWQPMDRVVVVRP